MTQRRSVGLEPKEWELESLKSESQHARVFSPSNIALAKYWGKRHVELNLPTNSSLSVSLADFGSFTTVEFHKSFESDRVILNRKEEAPTQMVKVRRILDELRRVAGTDLRARVQSANNFPTAAGLASSASGISAVTLAASEALGLGLPASDLSEIARKGSGSACRSFFGGYVEWTRGSRADGSDSRAAMVVPGTHWPLSIVIAVISGAKKHHASTGGMELTRRTSPYFKPWVECAEKQASEIRSAVLEKSFLRLADLVESNCIRMHASAMAAFPPVIYWHGGTIEIMRQIHDLRARGVPVFFTIDAGPNVVALMEPGAEKTVEAALSKIRGLELLWTGIGNGPRVEQK